MAKASEQLDIASALELSLSDEQEAKFLALKALHAKKIKQLMVSIDAKEKEVAKLKVLGKDSRRTQMIQALRGKIKDMEVIQDTIKEEFSKKASMSLEDVNDFIIRKTIGGPKRFRPLSREEMENKIMDYERRLNRVAKGVGGIDGGKSVASQVKSIGAAKDALTSIATRTDGGSRAAAAAAPSSSKGAAAAASGGDGLAKIAQLMEEINGLRNALDVAQGATELQKEEVTRLRQRNADLAADDEEVKFMSAQYKEAIAARAHAEEEFVAISQRLAAAEEEAALLRSGTSVELEQATLQLDSLQSHCEKLLKQNSSLLHRLADMETELDAAHEASAGAHTASKAATSSSEATQGLIRDHEKKIARLTDKLRVSEGLISELQADNSQISASREQLRGKNIAIKELTKHVEQLSAAAAAAAASPQRGGAGTGGAGDAALKEENLRLKQALQAALSSASPGGGGSLNLSLESTDMMKMKLQSANEESDKLHRQLERMTLALKEKDQQIASMGAGAAKKSPRDGTRSSR